MSLLDPGVMEPLLRGRFGRPYLYLEQAETTQRMLDASQPEGAVALCEGQTGGRGRMGRVWEAPAGSSILVSVLLRPPRERRAAELTLVAGVATAVVVERATGLAAQIKWPNDVMLDRRKVAGGLAELNAGRLGADDRGGGRPLEDPPVGPIPVTGGGLAGGVPGSGLRLIGASLLGTRRRRPPR